MLPCICSVTDHRGHKNSILKLRIEIQVLSRDCQLTFNRYCIYTIINTIMFTFQNFFMTFSVFLTSFKAFIFPLKEEICSNLNEKTS